MRYELYADSLFLVNFVMNLYILMLVDHWTFRTAKVPRLLLAAALGAGSYLLILILKLPVPIKLFLGAAGAAGMAPAAFSIRGLRNLLKILEKMLLLSFCMGGALTFLIRGIAPGAGVLTGTSGVLGLGGLIFLFLRRIPRRPGTADSVCRVTLVRGARQVRVPALIDSGNSLTEPISGKPVCVVDGEVFRELWGGDEGLYRAIPYHSIGKKKGILKGCLLPEMYVEADGVRKAFREVYLAVGEEAVSAEGVSGADSIKMILNPRLLM